MGISPTIFCVKIKNKKQSLANTVRRIYGAITQNMKKLMWRHPLKIWKNSCIDMTLSFFVLHKPDSLLAGTPLVPRIPEFCSSSHVRIIENNNHYKYSHTTHTDETMPLSLPRHRLFLWCTHRPAHRWKRRFYCCNCDIKQVGSRFRWSIRSVPCKYRHTLDQQLELQCQCLLSSISACLLDCFWLAYFDRCWFIGRDKHYWVADWKRLYAQANKLDFLVLITSLLVREI